MITKDEDLDALEKRLLRPGVSDVVLPGAFVAGLIEDLRAAKKAQSDYFAIRHRIGGEEDVSWPTAT